MGFQYYPENNMKYVVLIVMLAGLTFNIYGIREIVHNQLSLQSNFEHTIIPLVDHNVIVANSKHGKRAGIKYDEYIQ